MIEIERKFLVKNDSFKQEAFQQYKISQGYLNSDPARTTRIRLRDEEAFITVKGKSSEDRLARFEWEKPIEYDDANALLKLCEPSVIEKNRYLVKAKNFIFEVDEFYGDNDGLVVAEVELENTDDAFPTPQWLGEEVTGDKRYYNAMLSQHPFKDW